MTKASLACALLAVASLSATLWTTSAPAGADQVSDLQAQAAQLSSQMLLEQLQIGGYQQQYAVAIQRVQHDAALVAKTRGAIQHNQSRISSDTVALRAASVNAYEDGGSSAGVTPLFDSQRSDGSRSEYEQVLASNVSDAVDQLHTDRSELHAHEVALQQVQSQDQAAQSQAQSMLDQAQQTQQELQQQSATVNGQLAVAVAQQQAQEAAAAAAAVAAAQAKAAQAAAAQRAQVEVTSTAPTTATASTAAPSLNSFLQCVIQAESGGDYQAVSPDGQYMGAFQFSQSTWNEAAQLAGMPTLVGVPPDQASPTQQDDLAIALYNADGSQPWYDPCTGS